MTHYIKNNSLFIIGDEGKDEIVSYITKIANETTELKSLPGSLDKTLYQSESGFYFHDEGPYDFAVVGVEKKENRQTYVVLSNDKSYLERMLERN